MSARESPSFDRCIGIDYSGARTPTLRLKFVASALRHRYLWPEEEAVGFILSGHTAQHILRLRDGSAPTENSACHNRG